MAERIIVTGLMVLALSACGAVPASTPPPPMANNAGQMASAYGKARALMGMDAKRLIQMFGQPRLDIRDPNVRKLQFANGRCVLDAYLYASTKGKEPVVTYADSRLPNGNDIDPTACAGMLGAK